MALIVAFAPVFSKPVFEHAKVLLIGSILALGKRTVTACLRVCGKAQERHFQNYHRFLNRARWSPVAASRILLGLLISTFAPTGEVIVGLDDTIERRRGQKISAKGTYRDLELTIKRTTPVLLGLFSVVRLLAERLIQEPGKVVRASAWYAKTQITSADAIAMVRRLLRSNCHFSTSSQTAEVVKIPRSLLERLTDAVCYAA